MKLSKEEYRCLYIISKDGISFKGLLELIGEKKCYKILKKLARLELIKLIYQDTQIIGFKETTEGMNLVIQPKYHTWHIEFGG